MGEVMIAGIGQIPVGEYWDQPLHSLSTRALRLAMADSGGLKPQALYIGNFLAGVASHQTNLGALLAGHAGLTGVESFTLESADASGASAFRMGYQAVASGFVDVAAVVGVEKYTDMVGPDLDAAVALSTDYDFEAIAGLTPAGQGALVARRYLHDYDVPREALGNFALLAHLNGAGNPFALHRKPIHKDVYSRAPIIADPLNLYDIAPFADGAAAVILTRSSLLPQNSRPGIRISGSSAAIDTLALHDRPDLLAFDAARVTVERACSQAGIIPTDIDFFELTDSVSIYAALSLEAAGFAKKGEGWKLAMNGSLNLDGRLPILTLGGCKARGHPLAASGVYQVVEAVMQLRGEAGPNQLRQPRRAMVQALGGPASTAVTHILDIAR